MKRHLETLQLTHVNKPREFFQMELGEYRMQANHFVKVASADRLPDRTRAEAGEMCVPFCSDGADHGGGKECRR